MLKSAVSFWRRLVHKAPVEGAPSPPQEDRRTSVRYTAELQGNVQLANVQGSAKLLAQVRNLSRGGANLFVYKPIEAGQMVCVELPANPGEVRTVLACVVHAKARNDGMWSLGCVFSQALSDDDLAGFGANEPAKNEPRMRTRFSCDLTASYRKAGDAEGESHPAELLNISAQGIGLVVQPTPAGSLINIDLHDVAGKLVRTMLACVVHTTQRASGDCVVGCTFVRELTEFVLQVLLQSRS
jgi:hypothetical protein